MTGKYVITIINKNDIIVDLGMMRKAIVIRKTLKGKFIISASSFFPFPDSFYSELFSSKEDALTCAIDYFSKWFSETTDFFSKEKLNNNYLLK